MNSNVITIMQIKLGEWLPDRCLNGIEPFIPTLSQLESGCPSINFSRAHSREALEQLYRSTINKYGGCGFVAWDDDKVIAYHNFFPSEIAQKVKFYGCGFDSNCSDKILIHNCLTIVRGDYLRKGICSRLVETSIDWARTNGWKKFEVHSVLPDCEKGWQSDQKSCFTFWERFGFKVFKEYDVDKKSKEYYSVTKYYSMCLSLSNSN